MPLATSLFDRFRQEMKIRNYSPRTIKAYVIALRAYARFLHPRYPRDGTAEDIKSFLLHSLATGLSRSYLDQAISALRFLYIELYGWRDEGFDVARPIREEALPNVPSRAEILRLAGALNNRKHRLAVLLLYAGGLRVSELIAANVGDVDLEGLIIKVRKGKGRKDRITVLSAAIVEEIRSQCEGRPRNAPLVPSRDGGRWSARSCERVMEQAGLRAGLDASITPHSLRHAFATHLLEGGTDIKEIQALLGHVRVETTRRYARLRNPGTKKVKSPL